MQCYRIVNQCKNSFSVCGFPFRIFWFDFKLLPFLYCSWFTFLYQLFASSIFLIYKSFCSRSLRCYVGCEFREAVRHCWMWFCSDCDCEERKKKNKRKKNGKKNTEQTRERMENSNKRTLFTTLYGLKWNSRWNFQFISVVIHVRSFHPLTSLYLIDLIPYWYRTPAYPFHPILSFILLALDTILSIRRSFCVFTYFICHNLALYGEWMIE